MAGRDKPPSPMAVLARNGLAPATSWDAETLAQFPPGTEFDLICRTRRSLPQLRLYWAVLGKVVSATGRWPTREKLHEALKIDLGRTEAVYGLKGNLVGVRADSIALTEMTQVDFQNYFDQAMQLLSSALGFDPLSDEVMKCD